MATVYFSPVGNGQTFFNTSGVALAGGQIFTYIAGTTTPIATYTDSLGIVPNSNPIILNSAGQLSSEIWITQSVKFIIKDSLGVTIQTIDNIPAINNVSGTVIEWVASGLTPTYVSTTSFTVGGDQRTVFTKYRRLQITVTSGTVYCYVLSATFGSGITTIVVVLDSGVLDSGISLVSYGFVNPSTPSLYQNATVSYSVAISANSGTLTLLEKSVNLVDITGTLTASGNITTTFPTDSAFVVFDNSTSGSFPLTVNSAYAIPNGKSSWYWNGTTFELVTSTLGIVGTSRNVKMSVTAASATATLTADEIIVETALGGTSYRLASFSQSINLATTGAGGMDTGSAPVSGFVAVYAIYNPSTGASALLGYNATSAVAPEVYGGANMPAGYTASALVSVWGTNGSGQLIVGYQADRQIFTGSISVLNSTTPINGTPTSLSIAGAVPKNAKIVGLNIQIVESVAGSSVQLNVYSDTNLTAVITLLATVSGQTSSSGSGGELPIITSQTIYYSNTNTNSVTNAIQVKYFKF